MGRRAWCFLLLGVLAAYYIYTPLPGNVEEPWKLTLIDASLRTFVHLATFVEFLGLCHFFDLFTSTMSLREAPPTSDENVTVTDTKFNNIPVRVYVPRRKPDAQRRGVFYIHGGGWSLGSAALKNYDLLSRWTAERLDAVVVSTNYRLAPQYRFPIQFEDVYDALKWFLQKNILEEYGVDPGRIGVSGDSAGGNLAAAVTLQLSDDPEVPLRPKTQSLIYPALQALDMDTPSFRENAHVPILPRSLLVRFWNEYLGGDRAVEQAMLCNRHVPQEAGPLLGRVNWSSLLPQRFLKGHAYRAPTFGSSELARKYPGFLDVRAAPLLADDRRLQGLPRTHVVTCQYDILRDEGFMYVRRLRDAGVPVTHSHVEDGFHGALSFPELKICYRMLDEYLSWLEENL
ncbi:arylacetamide deacetylase [Sciurus carolinensis]|uniref:arylacetamide deacetylase n=1 Tax=Sciurus carolinensis TaxID=30640 RepID=UPI001FB48E81|nr:arylacetamide deacetylase [Sciurus carolinensis]